MKLTKNVRWAIVTLFMLLMTFVFVTGIIAFLYIRHTERQRDAGKIVTTQSLELAKQGPVRQEVTTRTVALEQEPAPGTLLREGTVILDDSQFQGITWGNNQLVKIQLYTEGCYCLGQNNNGEPYPMFPKGTFPDNDPRSNLKLSKEDHSFRMKVDRKPWLSATKASFSYQVYYWPADRPAPDWL